MTYIIHANGKGTELDIPAETTSEQYGEIHEAFARQYGKRNVNYASIVRLWPAQVINGIFYDWGLSGPDGAWYNVFQWPENSDAEVQAVVDKLRHDGDVVTLHVIKLQRVEFLLPETVST